MSAVIDLAAVRAARGLPQAVAPATVFWRTGDRVRLCHGAITGTVVAARPPRDGRNGAMLTIATDRGTVIVHDSAVVALTSAAGAP